MCDTSTSESVPKAVLYYFPRSIWSATALLTLEEKGYGDDEVDRRIVDLGSGAQFEPSFLRLNPKGTVPILVVPFEKTLSQHVESRYKAITETKAIVEFLDMSRSSWSRTHTTSTAPAPALAPATIGAYAISTRIIDLLHSDDEDGGDPNRLTALNARDHGSLKSLAQERILGLSGRQSTLASCLAEAENGTIHVSDKVKDFWRTKKAEIDEQLDVLIEAEKDDDDLDAEGRRKRKEFLAKAKAAWHVGLRNVLVNVNKEIATPYTLGDQLSVADLHLAAWMARLVKLSGGIIGDDGNTAVGRLEAHVGGTFSLPKEKPSKLAAFWDAMRVRASWQKIYGAGLY